MADGKGILAIVGGAPKEEKDDEPSTPKGRALKAMFESMQKGDFDEAAEHYATAYDICAAKHGEDSDDEEAEEAYDEGA